MERASRILTVRNEIMEDTAKSSLLCNKVSKYVRTCFHVKEYAETMWEFFLIFYTSEKIGDTLNKNRSILYDTTGYIRVISDLIFRKTKTND